MQRSTLIRRSRRWLIAPLAMALLGMTAQSSLAASQPVSPPDTRSHLEAFWNAHGVPKATQKSLLSKLAAGQTWDAVDGKHTPVSSSQATSNGSQETVDTYADGSIVVSDLEQPQTPPHRRERDHAALGGGMPDHRRRVRLRQLRRLQGVLGHRHRHARVLHLVLAYACYNGAGAKILSTGSPPNYRASFGSMTEPVRSLYRPQSTTVQNAVAKYQSQWTGAGAGGGTSSETIYCTLCRASGAGPRRRRTISAAR